MKLYSKQPTNKLQKR